MKFCGVWDWIFNLSVLLCCCFLLLLLKWWFWAGLLGSVAPCVLYGSTAERLGSAPGTFANHCLPYTGLYLLGNSLFGGNLLAPWLSYGNRTAIRRRFNLEVSYILLILFNSSQFLIRRWLLTQVSRWVITFFVPQPFSLLMISWWNLKIEVPI